MARNIHPDVAPLPARASAAPALPAQHPSGPAASGSAAVDASPEQLLDHRHIWRASRLESAAATETVPTGHPRLDGLIQGWPADGITELLCDNRGIGELRLLLPALAALSRQPRWVAWVSPPWIPYAPALAAAGLDVDHVLLIRPQGHVDQLWTIEQALAGGNCSAVLAWPDERRLRGRDLQRLRLAARKGRSSLFMFRPESAVQVPSAADLRLQLRPAHPVAGDHALQVKVLKRPSGWGSEFFQLDLPAPNPLSMTRDHLQAQLERWRQQQQPASATPRAPRQPLRSHPVTRTPGQPDARVTVALH